MTFRKVFGKGYFYFTQTGQHVFIVQHHRAIRIKRGQILSQNQFSIPKELIGKRVRLKLEVLDEK